MVGRSASFSHSRRALSLCHGGVAALGAALVRVAAEQLDDLVVARGLVMVVELAEKPDDRAYSLFPRVDERALERPSHLGGERELLLAGLEEGRSDELLDVGDIAAQSACLADVERRVDLGGHPQRGVAHRPRDP